MGKRLLKATLLLLTVLGAVLLPGRAGTAAGTKIVEASNSYTVRVSDGYLALRNAKAYDSSNEIGKLYNGETVDVLDSSDGTYWYVYAPSLNRYGYVNCNYLAGSGYSDTALTVSVPDGYLALRSAMKFDSRNEIGKLYTGDIVYLYEKTSSTYWYVYSPKYDRCGYVNRNYVYGENESDTPLYYVHVESGYLALRNAKAYESSNEIGKLYSGDMVYVYDTSDSEYWYVYSPKYDRYGYVNCNYLYEENYNPYDGACYTVSVRSGYLALRNEMKFDSRNEIGSLYNGEKVYVQDYTTDSYWYVYSPKLDMYGYVNCNYLY